MQQVFVRYEKWECFKCGLYAMTPPRIKGVVSCANLLSNKHDFLSAIESLKKAWPTSYLVHMTNKAINRRAYLGAACCGLVYGVNEDTVRVAWKLLDKSVQVEANEVAQKVIDEFDKEFSSDSQMKLFSYA